MSDKNCRGTYPSADKSRVLRFGVFELDLQEAELRKSGIRIKLQEQPFQILTMLLERPGQTVTREDLRTKLWSADTFVDFDHSLNSSIKKLREALGDDSENPRFIETLHRRGYRFIAPVDGAEPPAVRQNEQLPAPADEPAAIPPVQPNGSAVIAAAKQHKGWVAGGLFAVLVLLAGSGLEVHSLLHRPAPRPFQNFTVTKVTNSGKVRSAALSFDGRYVASVLNDKGMQSLWLSNLPTGSDTQILPPSAADYGCVHFSPDGNHIYFVMGKNTNWDGYNLFRSPVLGGNPQFVLGHMNIATEECYAFSPDGQRIVAVRLNYPEANKYQILTIPSEGGNETILQSGSTSKQPWAVAWHPTRDEIYYSFYSREEGVNAIDVFDLRAGKSHRFLSFNDKYVTPVYWLPDGQTMLVSFEGQIGFIPSLGRDVKPITRDANYYSNDSVSVSADGKTIAAVQGRGPMTLSVLPRAGREFRNPRQILSQPSNEVGSLAWNGEGDLVVVSGTHVLKLDTNGKNQTELFADSHVDIWACGTNYFIAHGQYHGGRGPFWAGVSNIWRINADGTNPLKLTDGKMDAFPVCSPDQKWVYYDDTADPTQQRIFRVPLDGSGKPEAILDQPANHYFSGGLALSADGKMLAAPVTKPPTGVNIALYEIGPSRLLRILDAGIFSTGISEIESTHDGNSVAYIKRQDGVDNLWVNRLDGSAPYPITDFTSDQIWAFSFSLDGKRLAVVRGHTESDVVLLHETKP